jgi:hypothetical protein
MSRQANDPQINRVAIKKQGDPIFQTYEKAVETKIGKGSRSSKRNGLAPRRESFHAGFGERTKVARNRLSYPS